MMVRISILIFLSLLVKVSQAQTNDCSLTISGRVIDEHDGTVLEFATIYIEGTNKGAVADSNGYYTITNVCPGNYVLVCRHVGCEPVYDTITLSRSTTLNFYPEHHAEELQATAITPYETQPTIRKERINPVYSRMDIPIQNKIKFNPSVSLTQTGARISKPVVWGLYGSRLGVIQDGIIINDQQWGQDHAPAIDNNVSTADVQYNPLKYSSEVPAGIINIISNKATIYDVDTSWGYVTSFYSTNGKNAGTSFEYINKLDSSSGLRYSLYGDYSRGGDQKAPNYYLTNTGTENLTFSTIVGYKPKTNWDFELGVKSIRRENGILQAAHVGNITDLQNALNSNEPLIVKGFSYEINNPRQVLGHDMIRLSMTHNSPSNDKRFGTITKLDYAYQNNSREEYDIRRAGREGIPAIDINLKTHYLQLNTTKYLNAKGADKKINTKAIDYGFNLMDETNINNPNTGIRPLIPNYESTKAGVYFIHNLTGLSSSFKYGARYEVKSLRALKYNFNNELVEYQYTFHLPSAFVEFNKQLYSRTSVFVKSFYGSRSPGVNELFSEGLHQSVASIEEGDLNLKKETSIKLNLGVKYDFFVNSVLSAQVYLHQFDNFIQIEAEDELRQTIQGAFPVFKYKQTDALLTGASVSYNHDGRNINYDILYRYLVGKDITHNDYLSFMPNNVARVNIHYHQTDRVGINTKKWSFKRLQTGISIETVFEQKNYPTEETLAPPPPTYSIFDVNLSYPYEFKNKSNLIMGLSVDNVLNTEYRDYLDRLRYFAALPGRNIVFNLKYQF